MLLKKSVCLIGLSIGLCLSAAPVFAQALTIVNNSNSPSTSIINNGICSSQLGSDGVTQPHTTHVVNDKIIALACFANPSNCKADVYMTNNCSGPLVATAVFDTKNGMKSIKNFSDKYKFTIGAFNIIIDPV